MNLTAQLISICLHDLKFSSNKKNVANDWDDNVLMLHVKQLLTIF